MTMKWVSVKNHLPPINFLDKWDGENKISIQVVVFMDKTEPNRSPYYFAQYYHNELYPHWSVSGYMGFDQTRITHWMQLYSPINY